MCRFRCTLAAFAQARGATRYEDLPAHVDSFVSDWIARPDHRRAPGAPRPRLTQEIRWPIQQMLRLVVPGYVGHTRRRVLREPFAGAVPGFFASCVVSAACARRPSSQYAHYLCQLEAYLDGIGLEDIRSLSPVVVSGFFTDRSRGLHRTRVRDRCGIVLSVSPVPASAGPPRARPERYRRSATRLPTGDDPAVDHLGRGAPHARYGRSAYGCGSS